MKLQDMHSRVKAELAHISNWPEPQGELRMLYNIRRMRSLGKKARDEKTRCQILAESIAQLKSDYPNYKFKYDADFFVES